MYEYRIDGYVGWGASTGKEMASFLSKANGKPVRIIVSSRGGDVGDALDMYNQLKSYQGETTAVLSGYCMSAASYIPMACDRVFTMQNSVMMIHNPVNIAYGDYLVLREAADLLEELADVTRMPYSEFSGKSLDDVREIMEAETFYFGGQKIVDSGFAHEVTESHSENDEELPDEKSIVNDITLMYRDISRLYQETPVMMGSAMDRLRLSAAAMRPAKTGGKNEKEAEKMPKTVDELRAKYPELAAEMVAGAVSGMVPEAKMASAIKEAEVKAAEDGKTAEAKRVSDVMSLSMPGYEKEIAAMALDGKTTKAEAALALLELERGKRNETLLTMQKSAPKAVETTEPDQEENQTFSSLEERCKHEFKNSKALQEEFFGKVETYIAAEMSEGKKI